MTTTPSARQSRVNESQCAVAAYFLFCDQLQGQIARKRNPKVRQRAHDEQQRRYLPFGVVAAAGVDDLAALRVLNAFVALPFAIEVRHPGGSAI